MEKMECERLINQENIELKEANKILQENNKILSAENEKLKLAISSQQKASKAVITCKDSLIVELKAELNKLTHSSFHRRDGSVVSASKMKGSKYAKNGHFCLSSASDTSVSRNNHALTEQALLPKRKLGFAEGCLASSEQALLPNRIAEVGPKNDYISTTFVSNVVPTELQMALAKFEEQQALSLNSLKRSFSDYEGKQGCFNNTLKETVTELYSSKSKGQKSNNEPEEQHKEMNSFNDGSSPKVTNEISGICIPQQKQRGVKKTNKPVRTPKRNIRLTHFLIHNYKDK